MVVVEDPAHRVERNVMQAPSFSNNECGRSMNVLEKLKSRTKTRGLNLFPFLSLEGFSAASISKRCLVQGLMFTRPALKIVQDIP